MIKEYLLKDGSKRFMYSGYYGTHPLTGKKIITDKRGFKTKKEAELAEARFTLLVDSGEYFKQSNVNTKITFNDFYNEVWLPAYIKGQTTNRSKPPTKATAEATKNIFRLHLLPLFGAYKMTVLNQNKELVVKLLTEKAEEYANFKALRSYYNSMFDLAVEYDYLEFNKLEQSVKRIKAHKKIELRENQVESDRSLTIEELQQWLVACEEDYKAGELVLKDYVLFLTTFFLSDRKSETYALKWKNIDFKQSQITIEAALDKYGNLKTTKGNKKTVFTVSKELISMLLKWRKEQYQFLHMFNLTQTSEQFVFTYVDTKGNVNKPLHVDYLNYVMNSIQKRNSHLAKCSPHKLRHTGATLAKQSGIDINQISEALTHSGTEVTKTYINTPNVIPITVGEIAFNQLKMNH